MRNSPGISHLMEGQADIYQNENSPGISHLMDGRNDKYGCSVATRSGILQYGFYRLGNSPGIFSLVEVNATIHQNGKPQLVDIFNGNMSKYGTESRMKIL